MKLILALICISFSLFAKDIHIASYNVENLFDEKNQGSEYKDFKIGRYGWSKKMANIKFSHTLEAIKLINADIIALQEVENKSLIQRLAKESGFAYYAFAKPFKSPVGVGVLSKYPIISKESIYAGIKKTRDFLHVNIDIDGKKLGIWVVHFPTQKHSYKKRLKVAKTLKKAVENSKDREFLMVGDFNTKISPKSILQKSFGKLGKKIDFYDPWFSVSYANRYSQVFYGKKSALDRMIINKNLYDGRDLEYKKNSFKVIKDAFLSDKKGYPNRWKIKGKNRRHKGEGYSDHFPIMLTITTDKKSSSKDDVKTLSIDKLYSLKSGKVDIKIQKAVVTYKNKNSYIVSQKGRGIYVFKPGFELKKGYMYDFLVQSIKDYKGTREITSLHVEKEYGKVKDFQSYLIKSKDIKKANISDVVDRVSGEVKGRYLVTADGKVRIFARDKIELRDGERLVLEGVRIGKYKKEVELIMEKTE